MFTGIVSAVGKVSRVEGDEKQRALVIETPYADVELGESIAINGTCMTAAELTGRTIKFFASAETCARTNLGALKAGDGVNLERAMRLDDRVSGHLVQGHVDGKGRLVAVRPVGESHEIEIELPEALTRYTIEKGSITLDGISLTINSVKNSNISLMIIPHTWTHTTLSTRLVGQDLNVELDMIAKYVERLLSFRQEGR